MATSRTRQHRHDYRLLLEKIPLAGIARVLKLSASLQKYVNCCYAMLPRQVQVRPKPKTPSTVQMDELWSFVDDKGNQQWVWLALDVATREIVGATLVIVLPRQQEPCGNQRQRCIDNVL